MSKTWAVYLVYNLINGKYYIGYTDNFELRWKTHCSESKYGSNLYFHKAIRFYKPESFEYQILTTTSSSKDAKHLEKLWIQALDANNPDVGYNMTLGGDGISGCIWATDGKQNIRVSSVSVIPDGWYRGRKEDQGKKTGATLRGRIWITDGISNKNIKAEENIPDGWHRGFAEKGYFWVSNGIQIKKCLLTDSIPEGWYKGRNKEHKKRSSQIVWITDGKINRCNTHDTPIPEGFTKGRVIKWRGKNHPCSHTTKQHLSFLTRSTVVITNGEICKRIPKTDPIPEGFRKGRLKNRKPAWNKGLRRDKNQLVA